MTELSKKILDAYQVRKTRKQKQAFAELLQQHIPNLQEPSLYHLNLP